MLIWLSNFLVSFFWYGTTVVCGVISSSIDLTPQKIRAELEIHAEILRNKGVDVKVYLFNLDDFSTTEEFKKDLVHLDVVEIGAGVRTIPMCLPFFEKLMNMLHEFAPRSTKICFNTSPADTAAAIEKWL